MARWEGRWTQDAALVGELRRRHAAGHAQPALLRFVREQGYAAPADVTAFAAALRRLGMTRAPGFRGVDPGGAWEGDEGESAYPDQGTPRMPEPEMSPEDALEQAIAEDTRKAREKEQIRLLDGMRKDEMRFRRMLDAITHSLVAYPSVPPEPAPRHKRPLRRRVVAPLLSDTHVGVFARPKEVGARFAYNYEEFLRRWERYKLGVWEFIEEQEAIGPIDHVAFWDLGDTVHNAAMHGESSRRSVDIEATVDQMHLGAECRAELLHETRQRFPHLGLTYDIESGNHDRISAKYGSDAPYDSWAVVTGMVVQALCRHDSMITVRWHTQEQVALSYWNTTVLLTHGHGIKGSGLLPWYGIDRRAMRWVTFHQLFIDLVAMGHYHNPADWLSNGTRILVNGAFPDTDGYAASLSLASPATQRAVVITEERGVEYVKDLPLTAHRRIAPTRPEPRARS